MYRFNYSKILKNQDFKPRNEDILKNYKSLHFLHGNINIPLNVKN